MTTRILTALTLTSLAAAAHIASAETVIVRNVVGYTPETKGVRSFTGMVIVDGKVQRLLTSKDQAPQIADAQVIDGSGRTLLPGLIDAHGHVPDLGAERVQVDLRGSNSVAEAITRIGKFAAANRSNAWILGAGWNQVLWKGKRFPTARELDAIVADRPAMLTRIDGHARWVNTAAMKIAGVTAATQDPPGGQIVRDSAGEPTGVFIDAAIPLIERHIPPPTDRDLKRQFRTAMQDLAALGLTGVHDAGISPRHFRIYQELGAAHELPIRIYAMLLDGEEARRVMESGPVLPQYEDRLQMRAVKGLVDGALGSRGAALLQDYSDQPRHRGLMMYTREQLQALATLTSSKGWQLNIHAIGDAGNRVVLDTFEVMLTPEQRKMLRPRIEHAQVITLEDIPRFAKLGVIASFMPTHATSDMNMAEDRLGSTRIQGAYAWRKLLSAGAHVAGGSDFPVELPNPFHGLYAAVTRQDRDGRPPGGWYPQEKLTREEALRLFTIDAAYAGHMEQVLGSLDPGKWADFILLDRDYFKVPESEIDDIRAVATYVAGRNVIPKATKDAAARLATLQ